MSIISPCIIQDKYCFVYCGPERCNCRRGNPEAWRIQQAQFGIPEDEPSEGLLRSGTAAPSEPA